MKEIIGHKGYFIDKQGCIFSMVKRSNQREPKKPVRLATWKSAGYESVKIEKKKIFIHRLLLETFVRNPKKGEQCRHLNGDRNDNRLSNLKWGTPTENSLDRRIHGTANNGERHGMNKYKKETIERIKSMSKNGIRNIDISRELKIPQSTVSWIILKGWR